MSVLLFTQKSDGIITEPMLEDEEKLKQFEKVLEKFSRFIKGYIQQFNPQNNGIDPEDISQEVKIKIWKLLNSEKKIKNYSSYIKKIINSSVIDQIRISRREEGIISKEKQKRISDQKSLYVKENWYEENFKEMIGQAVDSLRESRRKAVRLFLLNMSIQEIAAFLNWSNDKTRNLVYRGLNDLKKKLKAMGINYENK